MSTKRHRYEITILQGTDFQPKNFVNGIGVIGAKVLLSFDDYDSWTKHVLEHLATAGYPNEPDPVWSEAAGGPIHYFVWLRLDTAEATTPAKLRAALDAQIAAAQKAFEHSQPHPKFDTAPAQH